MHSGKHYRERAAQARRLAKGMLDPVLLERLTSLADEYDAIADRLEQMSRETPEKTD